MEVCIRLCRDTWSPVPRPELVLVWDTTQVTLTLMDGPESREVVIRRTAMMHMLRLAIAADQVYMAIRTELLHDSHNSYPTDRLEGRGTEEGLRLTLVDNWPEREMVLERASLPLLYSMLSDSRV